MEPLTMSDTLAASEETASGDPAQAFEALRTVVVELLNTVQKQEATADARSQSVVERTREFATALTELAKSPALAMTPAKYEREIAAAMVEPLRRATDLIEKKALAQRDADRDRHREAANDQVAAERSKGRRLCGCTLVAGLILYPLLGALMPGGTKLATWATGYANGWDAGSHLMHSADPVGWNKLAGDSHTIQLQETAIRACKAAAVLGTNAAACVVTLPKPVQPK
jgi:hypothetical protein